MMDTGPFAQSIGVSVYKSGDGRWWHSDDLNPWNPDYYDGHAFELQVRMRAEVQYLEGKQEAVISSNDGSISLSLPYGECVIQTTRSLIVKLALELMKRKR